MTIYECRACGREWCYYGEGRPVRCGKCKSPYWDRKRVRGTQGIAEVLSRMKPVEEEGPSLCRACESNLSLVKGKMVCMEAGCSMRGLEQ